MKGDRTGERLAALLTAGPFLATISLSIVGLLDALADSR